MYPSVIEKAAQITYAICQNHPFTDGNKRTAVAAMLVVLYLNDITIKYTQKELVELGLGIAEGMVGYEDVVIWISSHKLDN